MVKLLLTKGGVNPDSKDEDGHTPLSYTILGGHEPVVELLSMQNPKILQISQKIWALQRMTKWRANKILEYRAEYHTQSTEEVQFRTPTDEEYASAINNSSESA